MTFPDHGRVLFSATLVRGHIAKFHIPYLKWFKEQGWETWVAARNDYPDGVCEIPYCDCFVNIDFARSPFSKQTAVAYGQLRDLLSHEHFDLIHTHTPVASVLTRLAARDARRHATKVLYTAHGFHFYDGAPLANWLLWYPVERVMSRFTDVLITINREDYDRAARFAHCRVEYVPGVGIDTKRFSKAVDGAAKRGELGYRAEDVVVLGVGDLIKRKNHQAIIRALALLDERFKLCLCGTGVEHEALRLLAEEQGVADRVAFLGFRNDIRELMKMADMLVFPSIHEGLPVAVMEAMASGLPVIAAKIRGIYPDLIQDGESGMLLADDRPETIAAAITSMEGDSEARRRIASTAREAVRAFDCADAVLGRVTALYESCSQPTSHAGSVAAEE